MRDVDFCIKVTITVLVNCVPPTLQPNFSVGKTGGEIQ